MIIEYSGALYRYDLDAPPCCWDQTFKNFEYDTTEHGAKNQADLFFFTDSEDIAKALGQEAASKNSRNNYHLTQTEIQTPLSIIDFSNRFNIYQMLCLLEDLDIDVLISDFKMYDNLDNDFSALRLPFEALDTEKDYVKRINLMNTIKVHPHSSYKDIGLFGQRLTDFGNGINFRQLVKGKYAQVDGYRWREFGDMRGYSYCSFDPNKLSIPNTVIINSQEK